ncbi:unnamed protein product [Rhodiola kirilowii]
MDRSRSKRSYYYDNHHQDYDLDAMGGSKTKPRFNGNHHHQRRGGGTGGGFGGNKKFQQQQQESPTSSSGAMVTTSFRILCHDMKAGGVIGKSGSIIKAIRQHTGAWINVHELVPGDEERIIEITDTRRRDPDGRMPAFSPAQDALFMVHERILESCFGAGYTGGNDEEEDYGGFKGGSNGNRVVTRLVVSMMHVGSLLGKGGKIIEQMRMETNTQIRVLPRDHNLPRCVSQYDEIVQVVGDTNAVKSALAAIASRLRESQHRDRSQSNGRIQAPDQFYPPEDDFPISNTSRRIPMDGPRHPSSPGMHGPRTNSSYGSHASGYPIDSGASPMDDYEQGYGEELVFQILCPIEKVECIVGERDGIVELLQEEIGVSVKVADPITGSDETIITISSNEGPDDEMFPAQEALLHIQTRILSPMTDNESSAITRLVIPSSDIGCLEAKDGSLTELTKVSGADLQILSRDQAPKFLSGTDELLQIKGDIKASRNAILEVTSKIRDCVFKELFQKDMPPPLSGSIGGAKAADSPINRTTMYHEGQTGSDHTADSLGSGNEVGKQKENPRVEDVPNVSNRKPLTLVKRSILEVVIPEHAVPKLLAKSKNKLVQISELSGAKVILVDEGPEQTEKIIQISGTPDQAERAESLLQGFILSTQEDGP